MKERKDLKILLLQIREDPTVIIEEHTSFAYYSGLDQSQIIIHNVFDSPQFTSSILEGFDALFIGGASEASVLDIEKYNFLKPGKDLINYAAENSIPTFASCFGFQLAVLAFEGSIIRDKENFEMGTCKMFLTELATEDSVFKNINKEFPAVSVHQEKAIELPECCELLVSNDHCCQAFKVKNKPFWAFQFHPELDKKTLVQRLDVYKEKYTENNKHFQNVIDNLIETPESNQLLENFVQNVLLNNEIYLS